MCYLDTIFNALNVTDKIDKMMIAGAVYGCLTAHDCGITKENNDKVIDVILKGICTREEFFAMSLGIANDKEAVQEMIAYIMTKFGDELYTRYIWPYLMFNPVIEGVSLRNFDPNPTSTERRKSYD